MVVKTPYFHCRGTWAGSLVGEVAHAIKKKKEKTQLTFQKFPSLCMPALV